jgi:CheY-like chemotaxis protein
MRDVINVPERADRPPIVRERRTRQRRRDIPRRQADLPWTTAPRVLVVAAHVNTRLLYTGLLEEAGYAVYAAADTIEALHAMARRLPDAVVLTPDSSGADSLAVVEALRADLLTADVPAVIVTAAQIRAGASTSASQRHSGSTLLLREPASADVVVAAVDDLTRATPPDRSSRRQLRRSLLVLRPSGADPSDSVPAIPQMCALIDRLHPALLGFDAAGLCIAVSRGAQVLTGYSRADLIGTSVFDGTLGPHLPFAAAWQEYGARGRCNGNVIIRDRGARSVPVQIEFGAVLDGLHALALGQAALR